MINPSHLRYFVDAAKSGSLSEAAKKNRVSQSAVSQAIRSLEKAMGCDLTTHQKKVFHLTDEGKAVVEQADGVFRSLEQLTEAIQNIGAGYSGKLAIGCTNSVALSLMPPILSRLTAAYPKLTPVVRIGNSEVIKEWLDRKEIEIGIVVDDGLPTNEFLKVTLRSGSYVLFRGRHGKSDALVVTRQERPEVQHCLRNLARAGRPMRIQCEVTSWEAIKKFVVETGVFGLCPDYVIADEVAAKRLVVEPVPFKLSTYKLLAVYRARQPLGKNARLLVEMLGRS